MSKYTYDENVISDLHKDARGYRPRETFFNMWETLSQDDKQGVWDMLCEELNSVMEEEARLEAEALKELRVHTRNVMNVMRCTWDKALRILIQTEGEDPECPQGFMHALWKMDIGYQDRDKIYKLYKEVA